MEQEADARTHVFLDTSFLRSIGRRSLAGRVLRRMVDEQGVVLHVSDLVHAELVSQRLDPAAALTEVDSWFAELGVVRHRIEPTDGGEAFELYFGGRPPFKSRKNRNDIPDAFIFVRIRSFATQRTDAVHAVVSDDALRDALANVPGVIAHRRLQDLATALNPGLAAGQLREVCKVERRALLDALLEQLGAKLRDSSYAWRPNILGIAGVVEVEPLTSSNFDWSDADPIDADVLAIPFFARVAGNDVVLAGHRPGVEPTVSALPADRVSLHVEGWLDAQVEWVREGQLGKLDVRLDTVRAVDLGEPS